MALQRLQPPPILLPGVAQSDCTLVFAVLQTQLLEVTKFSPLTAQALKSPAATN